MILNSGLDAACTNVANTGGGASEPAMCRFITYACFGTSSVVPDVTDTALGAQVGSRSNSRGGFSDSQDGGLDPNTNTIWYEGTFVRPFNVTGNVNATEWGLAATPSGDLSVRDLFRADPNDPMSSPITLTLEDGDQLQLVVTFRVEAAWEYENKSFVITGAPGNDTNGTHAGHATVSSGSATGASNIRQALAAVWPGGATSSTPGGLHYKDSDQSGAAKLDNLSQSAASVTLSMLPYTPGDGYRDHVGVFSTATANGDHYAWVASYSSSVGNPVASIGLRFILTDPPFLTKASTHRLTLTVRKSIARL